MRIEYGKLRYGPEPSTRIGEECVPYAESEDNIPTSYMLPNGVECASPVHARQIAIKFPFVPLITDECNHPIIPDYRYSLITGANGSGKTTLAMALGLSLSDRMQQYTVLGLKAHEHRSVLYLDADNGWEDVVKKFEELGLNDPSDERRIQESFLCDRLKPEDRYALTIVSDQYMNIDTQEGYDLVKSTIAATRTQVLIIDSHVRFHAGSENESSDMANLNKVIRKLIRETKIAVITLHHTSKGGRDRQHMKAHPDDARGSAEIFATTACMLMVRRVTFTQGPTPGTKYILSLARSRCMKVTDMPDITFTIELNGTSMEVNRCGNVYTEISMPERILNALEEGCMNMTAMKKKVGGNAVDVAKHATALVNAGNITLTKIGKQNVYALVPMTIFEEG